MKAMQLSSGRPGLSQNAGKWPVLGAMLVWGMVGLSVAYWGLQFWGQKPSVAVPVLLERSQPLDSKQVARALGAGETPLVVPADNGRHALVGLATDASGHGVALISTDHGTAKTYRVGAALPDGMVLRSLGPRQAELALSVQAPVSVRLELPSKPVATP